LLALAIGGGLAGGRAAVDRAFTRLATCPGGYALYDLWGVQQQAAAGIAR
jgi:hypothetical protein